MRPRRAGAGCPLRAWRRAAAAVPTGPLMRCRHDAMIGGVCAGIARWLGWDPTIVRVLYVLLSVLSAAFPGILVYVILWIIIPPEP